MGENGSCGIDIPCVLLPKAFVLEQVALTLGQGDLAPLTRYTPCASLRPDLGGSSWTAPGPRLERCTCLGLPGPGTPSHPVKPPGGLDSHTMGIESGCKNGPPLVLVLGKVPRQTNIAWAEAVETQRLQS